MRKELFKSLIILQIIGIITIFFLTGCGDTKANNSETLKSKVDSEMSFLDTQLIDMLNELNGISFVNYIVSAAEIKDSDTTGANSKSESTSEGESKSGGEGSSGSDSSNSSSEESGSKDNKTPALDYSMQANGILINKNKTDWNTLKYDIEQLYSSWATIILDLYKLNINNDNILAFSAELDLATKAVKEENKKDSLTRIAKLYSYLPKYLEAYSNDSTKVNVLKTKSSLLNAYAIIGDNRLDDVKKELTNAEQAYMPIINNIETSNVQYNINKAYILIKEIQNSLNENDSDIFYIKYKNLMEELNIIQ